MNWLVDFAKSSIGAKVVMGATGLVLVGFVVAHMLGNLQVFLGQDVLNAYAKTLHDLGPLLWIARLVLIGSVVLHIASGLRLASLNKAARPVRYAYESTVQASFASRYMRMSGLVVFAFIVYHLAHFTLGVTHPEHQMLDSLGRPDVYSMVILGFQQPLVAVSYIVAMVLLWFHLNHGASSLFQSLGLRHPNYNAVLDKVGPAVATLVVGGNIIMPLAILTGVIGADVGVN